MAISSVGIGSGLDVESIVTQMIALEKQPIKTLEAKAEVISSKISTYGEIKSLTDDLNAAVRDLTLDRTWSSVKINSSSSTVANATMTGIAAAGSYNLEVLALAQAQTSVTSKLAKGTAMGEAGVMAFTVGGATHKINVSATDTLDTLVTKINGDAAVSKSVVASVVTDVDGNQQLMLRARETGSKGAFAVAVTKAPAAGEAYGAMPAASSNLTKLMTPQTRVMANTGAAWAKDATAGVTGTMNFDLDDGSKIKLNIEATDTLAQIASKINANPEMAKKSITATVVSDGNGREALMLSSLTHGYSGLSVTATSGDLSTSNLAKLAGGGGRWQDQAGLVAPGPNSGGQPAQDAKIRLNGVEMVGSSNTFADTLPGLSISISAVGTSLLSITEDKDAIKDSIQKFVDTYNALNDLLASSTKYDEESKVSGVLQGDSSTVSLQNSLRMLTQSVVGNATGAFNRLSSVGIQMLQGGKLSLDGTKMATALNDMNSLKSMFAAKQEGDEQGGIAVRFKSFTDQLLAYEGTLNTKADSLDEQLKRNEAEVEKIETRAETVEARLRKQYSALDVKMASLTSLSSYVEQMVTSWNKSKD